MKDAQVYPSWTFRTLLPMRDSVIFKKNLLTEEVTKTMSHILILINNICEDSRIFTL